MKKLTIHFGVHRTGSTSIQEAMASSRGILRSHGILYPRLFNKNNHVQIPWMLMKGAATEEDVVNEILKSDEEIITQVVLSAEDFCLLKNFRFFDRLRDIYDVHAVIYLKDQVAWLESWYNQHVKWPWMKKFSGSTPDFFLKNMDDFFWIDYECLVSKVADALPSENIYINVAGEGGVTNTVDDFLSRIGVDKRWLNPYQDRNASLTTAKLDILRRIDIRPLEPAARQKVLSALESLEVEEDDGRKIVFNDQQVVKISKKFEDSNKKVARRYFGRDQLFMDNEEMKRKPAFVSDEKAYKVYIPEILKSVARN